MAAVSVHQLEQRFQLEEERIKDGLPVTGRPFYAALRQRLDPQNIKTKGGDSR